MEERKELVYSIYYHFKKLQDIYGENYRFPKDDYEKYMSMSGKAVSPDISTINNDTYRVIIGTETLIKARVCCPLEEHLALEKQYQGMNLKERETNGIIYPKACFIFNEADPRYVYYVQPDVEGMHKHPTKRKKAEVKSLVTFWNKKYGVTPAIQSAMLEGARSGWYLPSSDPRNYDERGNFIIPKMKGLTR